MHAHVYEALIIDDGVLRILSPLMVEVLQRCMAKQPEDRYATAAELADTLALAAGRLPPRSGAALGETTATLTLATLPRVSELPGAAAATVLVPGVPAAETHCGKPCTEAACSGGSPGTACTGTGHFPPGTDSVDHWSATANATLGQPPRTAELARDCAYHRDWRRRPGGWADLWHPRSRSSGSFGRRRHADGWRCKSPFADTGVAPRGGAHEHRRRQPDCGAPCHGCRHDPSDNRDCTDPNTEFHAAAAAADSCAAADRNASAHLHCDRHPLAHADPYTHQHRNGNASADANTGWP